MGNHGDYNLDATTLESDVIDIDFVNKKLTVPWGIRRGDGIMQHMKRKPGIAWKYVLNSNYEDSLTFAARTGDKLTVYVCGNDLDVATFDIEVATPATSANIVVPVSNMDIKGFWREANKLGYLDWPWVTQHESGIDTISGNCWGIPFATRVDSLLGRLEKPTNATWELVSLDGIKRTTVKEGDKLRIIAESGAVKDFYIRVQPPQPEHNAYLASITWPDIPENYRGLYGWKGDTIPNFNPTTYNYRIKVPYFFEGIPALVAKMSGLNASVQIIRPTGLSGTTDQRTYTFNVTAEDDSVFHSYNVELVKEQSPENIQPYYAEPFLSEFVFWDQWNNSFAEIINPGNQPLDLSDYMIAMDWMTNPADMITSIDNWLDRYDKYVPGYKWVDEATWATHPVTLVPDLNVNPIVQPGDVFCMGHIATDIPAHPDFLPDYVWPVPAQLDVQFNNYTGVNTYQNPWDEPVSNYGSPVHKWSNSEWYLFKILNDSIKLGLKPATDPGDFQLIEVWGMGVETDWVIGGRTVQMISNWMRKPNIYKGNPGFQGSFGTTPENSEWTFTDRPYWQQRNAGWPMEILNIGNDIGQHFMYEPTHYKSTVSSAVYKVSEGYSLNENIRGVITGTEVFDFLANIVKADEGQFLKLQAASNGSVLTGSDILSNGDILVVFSADSTNSTKYVLEITDEGLNSDAVLTSSVYDVTVDQSTGIISGFGINTPVKTVLEDIKIPSGARLTVMDSYGNPVPLQILNLNDEYHETLVNNEIYFEVVAEDGITTITYQLLPDMDPSQVFVFSNLYQVNQDFGLIQNVALGSTVQSVLDNLVASPGASVKIMDELGVELPIMQYITRDDKIVVSSQDGTVTKMYHLIMLGYSGSSLIEIAGPAEVSESGTASYSCVLKLKDNPEMDITELVNWKSNSVFADVSQNGELQTFEVVSDETVTLSATYGEMTYNLTVVIKNSNNNPRLGNTEVYAQTSTAPNRRAIPVTFSEEGTINSISIYHNGGTGNVLLGVYSDDSGAPATLLGATAQTAVNAAEGWQTVSLAGSVPVSSGETVWLTFVFENNTAIRYEKGTPGRAMTTETWTSGMPAEFGPSGHADYNYSVYCNYTPATEENSVGNTEVYAQTSTAPNRRAIPVTFSEEGIISSISIYHNGGTGNVLLGVYSDDSGAPATLLGATAQAAVNAAEGWQTISTGRSCSGKHRRNSMAVHLFLRTIPVSVMRKAPPAVR